MTNELINKIFEAQENEIHELQRKVDKLGIIKYYTGNPKELVDWKNSIDNLENEISIRQLVIAEIKDVIRKETKDEI